LGAPGQTLIRFPQRQKRQRTSLIGGYLQQKLLAPLLFQGTCNTAGFNAWQEQALLLKRQPGTILILDNATFHRAESTRQLVLQAGCRLLFLPPDSPHLNPIEKWWGNVKRAWRYASHLSLDAFLKMSLYF